MSMDLSLCLILNLDVAVRQKVLFKVLISRDTTERNWQNDEKLFPYSQIRSPDLQCSVSFFPYSLAKMETVSSAFICLYNRIKILI